MAELDQQKTGAEVGREQEQPMNPLLALAKLQRLLSSRAADPAVEKEMQHLYEALVPALTEKVRSILPAVADPVTEQPIEPTIRQYDSDRGTRPPAVSSRVGFLVQWKTGPRNQYVNDEEFAALAGAVAALHGLGPDEYEVSTGEEDHHWHARAKTGAGVEKAGSGHFLHEDRHHSAYLNVSVPISTLLDGVPEGEKAFYKYRVLMEERAALEQRRRAIDEGPGGLSELYGKLINELQRLLAEICPTITRDRLSFKPTFTATESFRASTDTMNPQRMVRFYLQYMQNDSTDFTRTLRLLTTDELEELARRIALLHGDNVEAGHEQTEPSFGNLYQRIVAVAGDEQKPLRRVLVRTTFIAQTFQGERQSDNRVDTIECFVPLSAVTRRDIPIEAKRGECAQAARGAIEERQ